MHSIGSFESFKRDPKSLGDGKEGVAFGDMVGIAHRRRRRRRRRRGSSGRGITERFEDAPGDAAHHSHACGLGYKALFLVALSCRWHPSPLMQSPLLISVSRALDLTSQAFRDPLPLSTGSEILSSDRAKMLFQKLLGLTSLLARSSRATTARTSDAWQPLIKRCSHHSSGPLRAA
eukprot:c20389_g1_i1 orf=406-933(+)